MRITENRKLAFAVLALCVVISLFGLGGLGLARERSKVLTVYDRGDEPDLSIRHSMDAYLDTAAEKAQEMVSEAELYIGQTQTTLKVADLAAVVADSDIDTRYQAWTDLKGAVDELYNAVRRATDDSQFAQFKIAYRDFNGAADKIEKDRGQEDGYTRLAEKYNSLISSFPGGVVAAVTGQGALNTFGG